MLRRGDHWRGMVGCAMVLAGCGDQSTETGGGTRPPPDRCVAPNRLTEDGRCLAPGVRDDGCPAGSYPIEDGSCQAAGIAPGGCAEGFEETGDGSCVAVLPPDPCPEGTMALPGETSCRPVMPCGDGRWGDIPVDDTTVYVDQSHGGPFSGTEAAPFQTIGDAVASAPAGALIAVAPGSYVEDVAITAQPARLWGKCPGEVEVVGTDAAAVVHLGAAGSELHGVALTGPRMGVFIVGAESVVLGELWIHDTGIRAIGIEAAGAPTSATVRATLIERSQELGIYADGAEVTIEQVVIRDTTPLPTDQVWGSALAIIGDPTIRTRATVRASLFERSTYASVVVAASDATLEGVVVRDTLPAPANRTGGYGVLMTHHPGVPGRTWCELRSSVIERSRDCGITIFDSDATLEGVVVRDTLPELASGLFGRGISVMDDSDHSTLTVGASVVERNHDSGVLAFGAEVSLDGVLVRDTLAGGDVDGRGLALQPAPGTGASALATVRGCVVERSQGIGIFAAGPDVLLDGVLVRDTQPDVVGAFGRAINLQAGLYPELPFAQLRGSLLQNNRDAAIFAEGYQLWAEGVAVAGTLPRELDQLGGRGMTLQSLSGEPGAAEVRYSTFAQNHDLGICALVPSVVLKGVLIEDTAARAADGLFGDGLAVVSEAWDASVSLNDCHIKASARAGLGAFGAAATLSNTQLECNAIHLAAEAYAGRAASVTDASGNRCHCDGAEVVCQAQSSAIAPPAPITGAE